MEVISSILHPPLLNTGKVGNRLETFSVVATGRRVAAGIQRPGALLNVLQRAGQATHQLIICVRM